MADETLDLKAKVGLDNELSPELRRVVEDIKRFEKQVDRLKKSFQNPLRGSIIDPRTLGEVQNTLGQTGKKFNRLTKDQMAWAREQKRIGQLTTDTWVDVTNHINDTVKAFDKATGNKKKALAKQLKDDIGYARAFRYVYQGEHERYERSVQRRDQAIARYGLMRQKREDAQARARQRAADKESKAQLREAQRQEREAKRRADEAIREERRQMRLREREHRVHLESMARARRAVFRGINRVGNAVSPWRPGRGGGIAAAVGLGGAVMAGRSAIASANDLDRAEMNARINMSSIDARDLRNNWAMPKAVELGESPARLMTGAVEAAKAGVPENLAAQTSEMIVALSKAFGIEQDQALEGMGYAIAQEIGAGRMGTDSINPIRKLGNITAYLAAKTNAKPDQMISFMRTGMGSGAMLGMSQEATLAFGAAGIMAGGQGSQVSRALQHYNERIAMLNNRADAIRHKSNRTKEDREFLGLPAQLGYSSYKDIQDRIRKNPDTEMFNLIKSFGRISDPLKRIQGMDEIFGQEFGRILANLISSPKMMDQAQQFVKEASGQTAENDFLSHTMTEYMRSLDYFLSRVKAVWTIIKDELGDTMKPFIQQFSDWVADWYKAIGTSGLKDRFKAILDGLTEGFLGKPGTFRDLLDSMFGKPGQGGAGSVETFKASAKGFAEGIKTVFDSIMSVGKSVMGMFGKNSSDPEAVGKFVGEIVALVAALGLLSPVIGVLTAFATTITSIAAAMATMSAAGWFGGGSAAAGGAAAAAGGASRLGLLGRLGAWGGGWWLGSKIFGPNGENNQSINDDKALQDAYRAERLKNDKDRGAYEIQKQMRRNGLPTVEGLDPSLLHRSSYSGATDFSGRRRSNVDDLAEQLKKFGGNVERAAFISSPMGSFSRLGTGSGGSSGGVIAAVPPSLTPGGGGAYNLFSSTPGGSLPNFGVGRSGSIISNGRVGGGSVGGTDIPAGGPADMSTGEGLAGNAFLAARRGKFAEELNNDPNLRLHLAAMQMTEGASRGGTIESLMNRSDMQGKTMRQMLGYSADGRINPRSFYGPIRRGALGPAIEKLKRDPKLFNYYNGFTDRALAGSHIIGGHTDQGLPSDPNGSQRTGIPGLRLRDPKTGKLDGNEFTDWVGPGSGWGRGRQGAINYRRFIEQGISNVPSASDAIKNVPPPAVAPAGGAGAGDSRVPGNVAIHINGAQDPNALATLVQRRIDESMNWRAHDSESEYT